MNGGGFLKKIEFKAEVKKQLALRGWNYDDLGKQSGYTQGSIQVMMSDDEKLSERAIKIFAQVLGISLKESVK
jgi:lambda repressor-like predicted transcriptional regulator|nr:MAG TPA: Regulatory protein-modification, helix-turn-helix, transcriptional regulator, DNA [Caudoviricetes sp.]